MNNTTTLSTAQIKLQKRLSNKWLFWWFAIRHLPSLWFWKVFVKDLQPDRCIVQISFRRQTKNPFGSIYFSALLGAAELSTGVPVLLAKEGKGAFSMLVTDVQASFTKKALGTITFSCTQGLKLAELVANMKAGESETITLLSVGTDATGDQVCSVAVQWSILKKQI